LPVETARQGLLARFGALPKMPVFEVSDRAIADGRPALRIYRPHGRAAAPVVIFFHGGGFVLGGLDTHDALCRRLCVGAGAVTVSVDYALAPERKFPAGLDDCIAAVRWVAEHAGEFGGDAHRVALAGDSAGANLAIVTALRLGNIEGKRFRALLSAYPVTDVPDPRRPSYIERGAGFGLTTGAMLWFFGHYLDDPDRGTDPDVAPLRSTGLAGLPPTYVITAEFDPLRDEGVEFARKLAAAGVDVAHVHRRDANHGFLAWAGTNEPSAAALDDVCAWLATRLS
jgi:acetyl esterase